MTIDTTHPPRLRRTLAEAEALVAEWRASGMSKQAFCRERCILRSALMSCLSRVEAGGGGAPAGFIEVRRQREQAAAGLTLEIDGALRVAGLDAAGVAAVVAALRAGSR